MTKDTINKVNTLKKIRWREKVFTAHITDRKLMSLAHIFKIPTHHLGKKHDRKWAKNVSK